MLDRLTFAKRYSKALVQLLNAKNELDSGYNELIQIRKVLNDTPQLVTVLNNVSFPEAKKEKLVDTLTKNISNKYVKNLVTIIFKCGRMSDLTTVIDQFEALYDQDKGIVRAQLYSAVALTADQKSALQNALAKRLNANQVVYDYHVDSSIIGGVIIKTSDALFDGSIKTKINNVKQLLLN